MIPWHWPIKPTLHDDAITRTLVPLVHEISLLSLVDAAGCTTPSVYEQNTLYCLFGPMQHHKVPKVQ